ncbi:helix-turn-helix transcriptional regulator [Staphylococcus hominis]
MENKVKGYRCNLGLTQKKMADILGMSTNSYASKENGKSDFKVKEINKFINFMKKIILLLIRKFFYSKSTEITV